ncbi:hypothetical protein I553_1578 [Mycobacterium xenopi 4042]|uniref:Uncharacterized protein n=1 Tax=Mycobacterium xenopi 4042 TaxID=1299334 RepID=X8CGB1_MYCXE|nr:hypothetical protein I553_1578 [Mycobacterium xenopi 4042]
MDLRAAARPSSGPTVSRGPPVHRCPPVRKPAMTSKNPWTLQNVVDTSTRPPVHTKSQVKRCVRRGGPPGNAPTPARQAFANQLSGRRAARAFLTRTAAAITPLPYRTPAARSASLTRRRAGLRGNPQLRQKSSVTSVTPETSQLSDDVDVPADNGCVTDESVTRFTLRRATNMRSDQRCCRCNRCNRPEPWHIPAQCPTHHHRRRRANPEQTRLSASRVPH